jgi:hypothetical protein
MGNFHFPLADRRLCEADIIQIVASGHRHPPDPHNDVCGLESVTTP